MGRIKHRHLCDAGGGPSLHAAAVAEAAAKASGGLPGEHTMEFGWYHEFHRQVEGQSDAEAFDQGFEQVEAADRWGLDVFWLAEIHQQARRSVLSAPMNVAGQIAARTKRIKVGTAVHVLPLTHPLRLAEETATVDVASRGRFILGAGRSGNPRGYAAYGVPYSESRERFFDTLDILKKAWTQDSFSHEGKFHSFNEARAVPRPYQKPHPPIRIAGASEDTFPTLGRLGYPLFVSVRSASLLGLKPDLKAYREAYREAGHPGHGEVYLRLSMHVGETDKEAIEEGEPSIMAGYRSLITRLEGSPNVRRRAELEEIRTVSYETVLRDKVVVGGPESVTDRLKELEDELGIDGILFELNFGAAIPAELMMRSLQLICDKVMPHFK
jgi:alkanesulfonate monooxygenase SsuD/methylene tetrahydromethanopterin reductase-like flavin-dependent oxidoreductase (luciferase family)